MNINNNGHIFMQIIFLCDFGISIIIVVNKNKNNNNNNNNKNDPWGQAWV
jgi:hypothetical protein